MCYASKNVHNCQLRSQNFPKTFLDRKVHICFIKTFTKTKKHMFASQTFTTPKYVHNTHPKTFQDRKMHDCVMCMCMCAAADTFQSCLQCTDRALKLHVEIFDVKAHQKDRFLSNCLAQLCSINRRRLSHHSQQKSSSRNDSV